MRQAGMEESSVFEIFYTFLEIININKKSLVSLRRSVSVACFQLALKIDSFHLLLDLAVLFEMFSLIDSDDMLQLEVCCCGN